jgi:hypothetical protein
LLICPEDAGGGGIGEGKRTGCEWRRNQEKRNITVKIRSN